MPVLAHSSSLSSLPAEVWHAHALATAPARVQATGHALLDAQLPGGGWPVGAMTEVLQSRGVHCEWRLLLPALVRCGQGPVVLVGAPLLPFAPALAAQGLGAQRLLWIAAQAPAQLLWAAEQALRCAEVNAVLLWLPLPRPLQQDGVRTDQLRRLQMAAAEHTKLLFVMRSAQVQSEASPAVLRLQVAVSAQHSDALQVHLLKRRGPPLDQALTLQACSPRLAMQLALSAGLLKPLQPLNRPRDALDRPAARAA
jgi:protein ImuA